MSTQNQLQRFIFDEADIRGQLIQLDSSYQEALESHNYPPALQALLGEFLCAASILAATLKFDGIVTLQARANGPLQTIMAECANNEEIRCIAQYDESADNSAFDLPLNELLKEGVLAITIDPKSGQRYQGVVPLEAETLAGALAQYFEMSEQLKTKYWMFNLNGRCAAMMLQILPGENVLSKADNDDFFERLQAFADTVSPEEATELDAQELLHRLYHEEKVRLFESTHLQFKCTCSKEKTAKALLSIGEEGVRNALEESDGELVLNCQFCRSEYRFDANEVEALINPPRTTH